MHKYSVELFNIMLLHEYSQNHKVKELLRDARKWALGSKGRVYFFPNNL